MLTINRNGPLITINTQKGNVHPHHKVLAAVTELGFFGHLLAIFQSIFCFRCLGGDTLTYLKLKLVHQDKTSESHYYLCDSQSLDQYINTLSGYDRCKEGFSLFGRQITILESV